MGLATEPPRRLDLSLFTDDDRMVGARWLGSDGKTPVPIASATLTMLFDQPEAEWVDGVEQPLPPALRLTVDSTTPGDPNGWVDLSTPGVVLVTLPASMWTSIEPDTMTGTWDLVAVAAGGGQRCLLRGEFNVEIGVMT